METHNVDCLLVYPNNRASAYGPLGEIAAVTPPLEVALLAAFLRGRGFRVEILDAEAEGFSLAEVVRRIQARGALLTGVATDHLNSGDVTKMAAASATLDALRSAGYAGKCALFGVTPSAAPERTLRQEKADFVCQGEGYFTLPALLESLRKGQPRPPNAVPGLWFLKDGTAVGSERPPLWENPDELPTAAWDLLPMHKYRAHHWQCFDRLNARSPYACVYTNLGCPYDCSFCSVNVVFGRPNYRARSPESVMREIGWLVKTYKVRNIRIVDNIFTVHPEAVERLCDLLIREGHELNLWAYARVETVRDFGLVQKMRKAGMRWLCYGIEAGDSGVRRGVDKGSSDKSIDLAIELTRRAGIHILGNFIFGLPHDTQETMRKTLDLAKRHNFEWINFYCAMAYPGTKLHEYAVRQGLPLPKTWEGYGQYSPELLPLPTKTLSAAEILKFRDEAFVEYLAGESYLRMLDGAFGPDAVAFVKMILSQPFHRTLSESR